MRPGGFFFRALDDDGSLGDVGGEELLRLRPTSGRDERPLQPCSRCAGDLLVQWKGPWGTGVWMAFCPACDAERPDAGAVIRWHLDPQRFESAAEAVRGLGDRDRARPRLGPCRTAPGACVSAGPARPDLSWCG
ncbi:DUF6300 family protein [Streptomyces coeruleorubidus]|uniref:DUF6300 family protein n=1 Tax=Streptomyces coeruleorubidus TaxID=116188 RepID=UPI0037A3F06B